MLKQRRNARCTDARTQKILCCIVAILFSTDAATRLCARRELQWWCLKSSDLLFQMLCSSFIYLIQFRKNRRTKFSPSFLIALYIKIYICKYSPFSSAAVMEKQSYTSTHPLGHTGPVMGKLCLLYRMGQRYVYSIQLITVYLLLAHPVYIYIYIYNVHMYVFFKYL